jgi:hypothetical protein
MVSTTAVNVKKEKVQQRSIISFLPKETIRELPQVQAGTPLNKVHLLVKVLTQMNTINGIHSRIIKQLVHIPFQY